MTNHSSTKPRIFIASSTKNVGFAHGLARALKSHFDPTPWTDAFILSRTTIDNLLDRLSTHEYCAVIFSPDDEITVEKDGKQISRSAPRDNVIFEAGLFVGRVGLDRCFFIIPEESFKRLKIPTDLAGVTYAFYSQADYDAGKVTLCVDQPVSAIIRALENAPIDETSLKLQRLSGHWLSVFDYQSSQAFEVGKQYNLEQIEVQGKTFSGTNLGGWNSIRNREYLHKLTGHIKHVFLTGTWENSHAHNLGSFQFATNNHMTEMHGLWLGSDSENGIRSGKWFWRRIEGNVAPLLGRPGRIEFASKTVLRNLHKLMSQKGGCIPADELRRAVGE